MTTIDSKLTGKDTYGVKPLEGAELLGFTAGDDDFDVGRSAGGRGDRERRDRGGQQRRGNGRGRRQGKIEVTDEAFPAL